MYTIIIGFTKALVQRNLHLSCDILTKVCELYDVLCIGYVFMHGGYP